MVRSALGMIEVKGLVAVLEASDAALKAADVQLIGYESTKGSGLMVLKFTGEVSAVEAALAAAVAAASKVTYVFASRMIPGVSQELAETL
jgi:microcompartment protein CcmL/EutN